MAGPTETRAEGDAEAVARWVIDGHSARPAERVAPGVIARKANPESEDPGIVGTLVGGIMGEFNENPTVAMIGVDTIVSLVPFLDQASDARDLTAHIYYMTVEEKYKDPMRWVGLAFSLIGVIPEIGSAIKGVSKFAIKGTKEALGHLDEIFKLFKKVAPDIGDIAHFQRHMANHWDSWLKTGVRLFDEALDGVLKNITSYPSGIKQFFLGPIVSTGIYFAASKYRKVLRVIKEQTPERLAEAFGKIRILLDDFFAGLQRRLASSPPIEALPPGPVSRPKLEFPPTGPGGGVSDWGYRPKPGERSTPRQQYRAEQSEARWEKSVDEAFAGPIGEQVTTPKVTGGMTKSRIDDRKVPPKPKTRLDIQDIPRRPGETAQHAIVRIRKVIGRRLSDIPDLGKHWTAARQEILESNTLTSSNYTSLYEATRNNFWRRVRSDPTATKILGDAGFNLPARNTSAPVLSGVNPKIPVEEIRITLDHIAEKAQKDNWKKSLDADNLRMEFGGPNSQREIIQSRHPDMREEP